MAPEDLLAQLGHSERQMQSLDQTDGLRMQFVNGDMVQLRPSCNAPELRCYTESTEQATAQELV